MLAILSCILPEYDTHTASLYVYYRKLILKISKNDLTHERFVFPLHIDDFVYNKYCIENNYGKYYTKYKNKVLERFDVGYTNNSKFKNFFNQNAKYDSVNAFKELLKFNHQIDLNYDDVLLFVRNYEQLLEIKNEFECITFIGSQVELDYNLHVDYIVNSTEDVKQKLLQSFL